MVRFISIFPSNRRKHETAKLRRTLNNLNERIDFMMKHCLFWIAVSPFAYPENHGMIGAVGRPLKKEIHLLGIYKV